ncbi:hypothetical protein ACFVGM_13815 [Kitasatospora purpeofusca]|uniref:hypothetical protein n=1 Tax=Kitasatospora purpeofusca TaxID=67352 RepID=UPI00368245C2
MRANWEAFLGFGDAVEIRGDYLSRLNLDFVAGLGLHAEPPEPGALLRLHGRPTNAPVVQARVEVVNTAGKRLASLPLSIGVLHSGQQGFVATGHDPSGSATCHLRVNVRDRTAQTRFSFAPAEGLEPSQRVTLLEFAKQARSPHLLRLTVDGRPLAPATPFADSVSSGAEVFTVDELEAEISFMRKLADIQSRTATPFGVPATIPDDERLTIAVTYDLLQGAEVELPGVVDDWSISGETGLKVGEHAQVDISKPDFTMEIFGNPVPLGPAEVIMPPSTVVTVQEDEQPPRLALRPMFPGSKRRARLLASDPD